METLTATVLAMAIAGSVAEPPGPARSAVALVEQFWQRVWNPPYDLKAIDELLVEDFVITNAGIDVSPRPAFKQWVASFQARIGDLRLEPIETFANAEGTRAVSRWVVTGTNQGVLGTPADGRPVRFTGIAVWEIRDGRLAHNWVERSAWELYQSLQPPVAP